MSDDIPDLRRLIEATLREMAAARPELVQVSDADRVMKADNTLLVTARVLMSIAKRAGIKPEAVPRIMQYAKFVPQQSLFTQPGELAKVDGHTSDWQVMQQIDDCMADLGMRARIPDWFLEYWPSVVRRAASHKPLTDREKGIALYVASMARGER